MVIDVHVHPFISSTEDFERNLHEAEKYDARLCVFSIKPKGVKAPILWKPTAEYCRQSNDEVLELMRQYPKRMWGFSYVNPMNGDAAVKELDRCVHAGMVGMKLWIAVRCSDPIVDPLFERCAHYGIPTLQHTWLKAGGNLPGESTPMDLAALARRHPNATLIMGHSGGDWEYGFRCARHLENVYFDIGGGEANSGLIERGVDLVGADRILFGSDMPIRTLSSQLAKVFGANISDEAKEKIVYKNAAGILERAQSTLLARA